MQHRSSRDELHRFADLAVALVSESANAATMLLDRDLRIRGVNSAYEAAYLRNRKQIVGRFLFDVFPDNPGDPKANGVTTVAHALRRAMCSGGTATVPIVRYDIADPDDPEVYLPRLWAIADTAIYDGPEQLGVLHRVTPITTLDAALAAIDRALAAQYGVDQVEQLHLLSAMCARPTSPDRGWPRFR
jgi:PAS domain-containing protein